MEQYQPSGFQRDWAKDLPPEEWQIYRQVLAAARQRGLEFAIGGGFAFSVHSGRWRYTRDVDLYIDDRDRQAFLDLLAQSEFEDYYDLKSYDRGWIYRGYRDGVIIDLIWQMANKHAQVDQTWIERGTHVQMGDLSLRVLAPEELIWAKLFVVQRDRCDWPDLMNVINMQGPTMNWEHLLARAGSDRLLLSSVMCLYRWLCPQGSERIPPEVWSRLNLDTLPMKMHAPTETRPDVLLDSRDWFGPTDGQNPCMTGE